MKKYVGGEQVKGGTYLDIRTGQLLSFSGTERSVLPVTRSAKYVRLPVGIVFVLGPLAGLAYIIFLPLAGIVSLAVLATYKVRAWTTPLVPKHAKQS